MLKNVHPAFNKILISCESLQGIMQIIHPAVNDVQEFLWHHLEKDMEVLRKTLNLNCDDTAIMVHLILNTSEQLPAGLHKYSKMLKLDCHLVNNNYLGIP